jgi:hypothetical protein
MKNHSMHNETEQQPGTANGGQYENMYEELNCIAKNNKIQIMFKTQDEDSNLPDQ